MKKYLFLIIILSLLNCQKKENSKDLVKIKDQIVFGHIDSIHSSILNESRKIWVHVPGGSNGVFSQTKYPVLYLLDGPGHFYSVTGMIKQLSTTNGNSVVPEMIIVGIPNTNRTRDLTPTSMKKNPFGSDDSWLKESGGGENFNDFIENELIPYINEKYPTTPYRTYVGHSLGGLTVINTLLTRPHLFNNYIAIDPSIWWDNAVVLKTADTVLTKSIFNNRALYVGIANTLDEGMGINEVYNDTTVSTEHIRSILKFVKSTELQNDNGFLFGWKYYENDNHGSVPLIAEYDALRFLFPWYNFTELGKFYSPDSKATAEELINIVTSHYKDVSNHFGYSILPDEQLMNGLGYNFMSQGKFELSFAALNLNIQNFPKSSNVYDSMGDYYLSQKDSLKALEFFTKALEIGPNDFSQEKIDMLKENLSD
jgi:predicted alpha/beta superfamily hydrolase